MLGHGSKWMKTVVLTLVTTSLFALPALAGFQEDVARDLGVKSATLVAPAGSQAGRSTWMPPAASTLPPLATEAILSVALTRPSMTTFAPATSCMAPPPCCRAGPFRSSE